MALNFQPTKEWSKEHRARPRECIRPDVPCYCILDHFNQHGYGFCVGISLAGEDDDLDMIRFCDRAYDTEANDPACTSRQWHPNEAQLVSIYLSFAVINAWSLLPEYRKQLGNMGRQRTRQLRKKGEQ